MKSEIKGRCFCGSVRFALTPPTDFCSHCHCESCRRSHSAGFVTWTSVPNERFKILSGEERLSAYESSPKIEWIFCRKCGCQIFQRTHYTPEKIYVAVASLTDPLDREPDSHVSFEEHVPWIKVNDGLPCYREKSSDRLKSSNSPDKNDDNH